MASLTTPSEADKGGSYPERGTVSTSSSSSNVGKERTIKRDTAILREFDASADPNLLVLYHHFRDQAFDCFNASEYHIQMLRYLDASYSVVEVVPRKIGSNDYLLVCLRHKEDEKNTFCEVGFQVQRQVPM